MRAVLLAAIVLVWTPRLAAADPTGDLPCTDVRQVMDDFDNRQNDARQIWHWIGVRFQVDDEAWTGAGHDSIASKWSAKGLANNEVLVTVSCGQHRDETLADRTDDVFTALAQMETTLGAAK